MLNLLEQAPNHLVTTNQSISTVCVTTNFISSFLYLCHQIFYRLFGPFLFLQILVFYKKRVIFQLVLHQSFFCSYLVFVWLISWFIACKRKHIRLNIIQKKANTMYLYLLCLHPFWDFFGTFHLQFSTVGLFLISL